MRLPLYLIPLWSLINISLENVVWLSSDPKSPKKLSTWILISFSISKKNLKYFLQILTFAQMPSFRNNFWTAVLNSNSPCRYQFFYCLKFLFVFLSCLLSKCSKIEWRQRYGQTFFVSFKIIIPIKMQARQNKTFRVN